MNTYPALMAYKIPSTDDVADALLIVMHKNPNVSSQRELTDLVRLRLQSKDPDFRVGGERIRKIGLNRGIVEVDIEYNSLNVDGLPDVCQVCGNQMSSIKNMTLYGETVEVKRRCPLCRFSTGPDPTVPRRYNFTKKR